MRELHVALLFVLCGCGSTAPKQTQLGSARTRQTARTVASTNASTTTVLLYTRAADAGPLTETAATPTLWTAPPGVTRLVDVIVTNGPVAITAGTDQGPMDGWAQPEVCWGQGGSASCEWMPTFPADECGIEPLGANATLSMATLDPGCTGLGLGDGMGGQTWPQVSPDDAFTFDTTKWVNGLEMGSFTVSIVVE